MHVNPGPSRQYGRPAGRAEAHGKPKSTGKLGGQTHVKRHLVQDLDQVTVSTSFRHTNEFHTGRNLLTTTAVSAGLDMF